MTPDRPNAAAAGSSGCPATEPAPFSRLLAQLRDLDYQQVRSDKAHTTRHVAAGVPLVVEFDDETATPPMAHLAPAGTGQPPAWRLSFTADTPDRVQLMVLYAALNADADPLTALDAVSAALRIPPDRDPHDHTGS